MKYICFNSRDQLLRLDKEKIVYFKVSGNYTEIVMTNKLRSVIILNLGGVEEALATQLGKEAEIFMRVGRSLIVNRKYIYQVNMIRGTLVLSDFVHFAYQIPVSRRALARLREYVILLKE